MRLRQVLTNLAGNAVKFTDHGGVCVDGRARRRRARCDSPVIDTGPGVPADRRAAIFEDFEQGDGSQRPPLRGRRTGPRHLAALVRRDGRRADPRRQSRRRVDLRLRRRSARKRRGRAGRRGRSEDAALRGRRALIIAHSPFEAPAMAARLTEAGAVSGERADGLKPASAR